jgi:endonuclease/exonuclease/phosphatase family metal-dependent hydrolase
MKKHLAMLLLFATLRTDACAAELRVRIAAANASSGNNQTYDEGHGVRILQALKPDIILIQEFRTAHGTLRQLVDLIAGPSFDFHRDEGETLPNGIISRYPIVAKGCWEDTAVNDREFDYAKIQIPGNRPLWAVSLHLKAGASSSGVRTAEATQLVEYIGRTVPQTDYLVVGGDFNTQNRQEPCLSALAGTVVIPPSYPADQTGDGTTSANRTKPLDWVLANKTFHGLETPVVIGPRTFPNGLVFDARVPPPLQTTPVVSPQDSGAVNMQHMVVIRDFMLQKQ